MNSSPKAALPSNRAQAITFLRKQAERFGLSFDPSSKAILRARSIAKAGGNHQRVGSSRRLADWEEDQACVAWEQGHSMIRIGEMLDISRQAVHLVLTKHGYDTSRGAPRQSRLVTA